MKNPPKENKKQASKNRIPFYKWCKKRGFIIEGYIETEDGSTKEICRI